MTRRLRMIQTASIVFAIGILGWLTADVFAGDHHPKKPLKGLLAESSARTEIAGQYIVRLRSNLRSDRNTEQRISERIGARRLRKMKRHDSIVLIEKPAQLDEAKFLESLQSDAEILSVEPNLLVSIPDPHPDEIYTFSVQEKGIGTDRMPIGDPYLTWGFQDIQAHFVLSEPDSAPLVAVIDTGVDYTHPELSGRVIDGYDFQNDDADPMDDHGHGTHVSGIIAAEAGNGLGSAGISSKSRILAIKVLGQDGYGSLWNVTQGIYAAADHDEVRVINLSLGCWIATQTFKDAIDYAVGKGKLIVCAAGNNNTNKPYFPAIWSQFSNGVVAVAANDPTGCKAYFSNYGFWVTISAPGLDIFSTLPGNSYGSWSGTSMAAPFVAGVAARLLAHNPDLKNSELADILENNGDPNIFNDQCWPMDSAAYPYEGKTSSFAHLNLFEAINGIPGTPKDEEPPTVEILLPTAAPTYYAEQGTLDLSGTAADNRGVVRVSWTNDRGGFGDAIGTNAWETRGIALYEGENRLVVTAYDSAENRGQTNLVVSYLPGGTFALDLQVASPGGDSSEKTYNGVTLPTYSNAVAGQGYIIGLHFNDVIIPQGAIIVSAELGLHCSAVGHKSVSLLYNGEASDEASSFTNAKYDLSSRPKTIASIVDKPGSWIVGDFNASPDLRDIIQEIVNRAGWWSGSSLNLFIHDQGSEAYRSLSVFEKSSQNAAKLSIRFRLGDGTPSEDSLPPDVFITSPHTHSGYTTSQSVLDLSGTASDNVGVVQVSWATDRGESGVAQGLEDWSIRSIPLHPGANVITVAAEDAAGNRGEAGLTVDYYPDDSDKQVERIEYSIMKGIDDAAEKTYNGVALTTGKTMYVGSGFINGFRFDGVQIPQGAKIVSATLNLYSYSYGSKDVTLRFTGEATAAPEDFADERFALSNRKTTKADVVESVSAWIDGEYNASPDLSRVIQEIVSLPDWQTGSSLALYVEDQSSKGYRIVECFEKGTDTSAILKVEFLR